MLGPSLLALSEGIRPYPQPWCIVSCLGGEV
jgi:hypothetical protein